MLIASCGGSGDTGAASQSTGRDAEPTTAESTSGSTPESTSASPSGPTAGSTQPEVREVVVEVLEAVPHDPDAFTQGLVFDEHGRLFESTGREGESSLREVDPFTGAVTRSLELAPDLFGEGLALVEDRLVQLTWQEGIAFAYDRETFEVVAELEYEGEGWGLCYDGERLVMSDGSATLTFRDPATFEAQGSVEVRADGEDVPLLNELECVGELVYANVWETDSIVVIDPATGAVETMIDATALERPAGADVLNGIAVDPAGELWLTGKQWDSMYRVRLVPAG